ncbi:MAG: DUF3800 domain-containing protein [Chloroflexia bacterium]|nr:DUF3800 domain-containing protein [Chloroflexia bacterium]
MAMFVYLDESGDTGFTFDSGSSAFFVITLLLVDDPIPFQTAISRLRQELGMAEETSSNSTGRAKSFVTRSSRCCVARAFPPGCWWLTNGSSHGRTCESATPSITSWSR